MPVCCHCGTETDQIIVYIDYDECGNTVGLHHLCLDRQACWQLWSERYYDHPLFAEPGKEGQCKSTDSIPPQPATALA